MTLRPLPDDYVTLSVIAVLVSTAFHGIILTQVADVVRTPYMDEVFHAPQAMRMCLGQWGEWDSGITTFPGVYLVSAGISRALGALGVPLSVSCGLGWLRGLSAACNVLLLVVGLAACAHVYQTRSGGVGTSSAFAVAWPALVVAAWPPLALYGFLYYTDAIATLCIVASWALSLGWSPRSRRSEPWLWASAAVGAFAVLMRQTNAVWVAFVAGEVLCRAHAAFSAPPRGGEEEEEEKGDDGVGLNVVVADALRCVFFPLRQLFLHGLVVLGFVAFVVRNGGTVVLGDKTAHEPVWHWVQLCCAILALGVVASPFLGAWPSGELWKVLFSPAASFATPSTSPSTSPSESSPSSLTRVAWALVTSSIGGLCMTFGAHAHPYLLADNRHYTFYLWRRVLSLPLARAAIGLLLPVPFFLASHALRVSTRSLAIVHCFWIACLLTLVPAPLLEPRYWTPAVVLFLLHLDGARTTILASYLLLVLCATGTCAVVAIFLLLPYRWNDNSIARFVF